jgi:hypothetical protein
MLIHIVSLHDMFDIWCAMNVSRIIGPIFSQDYEITLMCYTPSDTIFLITCQIVREPILFFQEDSVTIHTANNFVCC